MEKTTKRIILSIVTLVLVVVALGTTTFAWFTLSNVATVSNIEGSITGGDGLEIAYGLVMPEGTDNYIGEHRTHIGSDEWTELLEQINNGSDFVFSAVSPTSSTSLESFSKLKEDGYEMVDGSNVTKLVQEAAIVNQDYLEFQVHFRSSSAGIVYWTGFEITGTTVNFTTNVKFTDAKENEILDGATIQVNPANAARISVGNTIVQNPEGPAEGFTNNKVMGTTAIEAGQFSYLTALRNRIYWPLSGTETAISSANVGNIPLQEALTELPAIGETGAVEVDELSGEGTTFTGSATVRIWIEGWDADTFDSILELGLTFGLTFEKAPLEPENP